MKLYPPAYPPAYSLFTWAPIERFNFALCINSKSTEENWGFSRIDLEHNELEWGKDQRGFPLTEQ